MYIAAVRIADDFGCATIGIQYQQGLKDLLPASDLVEGTLNNADRPPVTSRDGKRILYEGEPLAALQRSRRVRRARRPDDLSRSRAMGQPVENTLHDLRWGDWDQIAAPSKTTSGCSRSAVPRRRRTSSAAGQAPRASASRRCISRPAAARLRASPSRAKSSGRASTSKTAG